MKLQTMKARTESEILAMWDNASRKALKDAIDEVCDNNEFAEAHATLIMLAAERAFLSGYYFAKAEVASELLELCGNPGTQVDWTSLDRYSAPNRSSSDLPFAASFDAAADLPLQNPPV